jgi:hypothetical protein
VFAELFEEAVELVGRQLGGEGLACAEVQGKPFADGELVAQGPGAVDAVEDPQVTAKMTDLGLETRYLDAGGYRSLWEEQEADIRELLPAVTQG